MSVLHHVSDTPGIALFEPRIPDRAACGQTEPVVWAVDADHLPNYLLPRDCPRVTFCARDDSRPEDIDKLMCGTTASRVIAVECCWVHRIIEHRLVRYEFDPNGFELADEIAGYYVSREPVVPVVEIPIGDILAELLSHDVELRVMPSLWKLRDEVINSSLGFSLIRMRNAQPPAEGYEAYRALP